MTTQQRRKILLLDNGKEWGGGTNSMLELLKRIDREQFDITCCFYYNYMRGEGETIEKVLNSINIPVIFQPQRKQPRWARIIKEVSRAFVFFSKSARKKVTRFIDMHWRIMPNARHLQEKLRQGRYDILYMNNQPDSNIEGYLAAEKFPVCVVQHCRIEPVMSRQTTRLINRNAQAVIAVSQGVEQVLLDHGVRRSLCKTVPNAIDIHQTLPDKQAMRETLGIDKNTFVFGSIGSLIPRKANQHTLRALNLFSQRHPEAKWKMILVGEGVEREALEKQVRNYHLHERIIFTGFRNNPFDYLAAFDAFILSSKSEGLPRVILEAMLLKTAVIGSQVTGTAELIIPGSTGLLFPYGDTKRLAQHIEAIWQDSALRQRLTDQAYIRVTEHYAIENYVDGVEGVLGKVKLTRNTHV